MADSTAAEEVISSSVVDESEVEQSDATTVTEEEVMHVTKAIVNTGPSMSWALFVFWILPILVLAVVCRIGVDTEPPAVPLDTRPVSITLPKPKPSVKPKPDPGTTKPRKVKYIEPPLRGPTAYQRIVKDIRGRKRVQFNKPIPTASTEKRVDGGTQPRSTPAQTKPQTPPTSVPSTDKQSSRTKKKQDSQYAQSLEILDTYRSAYEADPDDALKALNVADMLRRLDLTYHDGGSRQLEALEIYERAIELTIKKREKMIANGESTNMTLSGTSNIPDEIMLDNSAKSVDGLLCSIYTNKGKQYFMANMFEKAVSEYTKCIEMEPLYLDAVGSRGSAQIILGQYKEAGVDFQTVLEHDKQRMFNDVFTGMAKLLSAKEDAVPSGWDPMIDILEKLIPQLETNMAIQAGNDDGFAQKMFAETLTRLHHVMFMYYDGKTKDFEQAWHHLETGYKFKMSVIPPYPKAFEKQKLTTLKGIFQAGFWPLNVGIDSFAPIFIIGFVRSGSTLLERVLDAHPLIVGTGEDSVFNGRLDEIRNAIVSASMSGEPDALRSTVNEMAYSVVDDMRARWKIINSNTGHGESHEPQRFADKMLTNYFNVGFIHLLFPKALILHVARNPMDTIFSAFKHEFPPGGLDYTSDFLGLADMYHSYRDIIEHWDNVLPGRVTHVRYEDMVHDMPGMARAIIDSTGLSWDDSVLEFHTKKHAVNTLSTTQVRKGVYNHSLEAWKVYEKPLQPLVKIIGERVEWNLKTTLHTYKPLPTTDEVS